MRKRFVLTTALLIATVAFVIGCGGRYSSVQPGEIGSQSRTSAAQSTLSYPGGLPKIDPSWMRGAGSPQERALGILKGEAGGQLPAGTRLYSSDAILVRDGNHLTLPWRTQVVSKRADGRIVLLDPQGQVVQVFSPSAVIEVQKNAIVHAVLPGEPLPKKYANATPFEVIK